MPTAQLPVDASQSDLAGVRTAEGMRRILNWAGVDRATAFGIAARLWSMVAGPVTMFFIASRFSKEIQGYYYTFFSLLALQVFLELGLGQVILQFSSHEWARLGLNEEGAIIGDPQALSRLASIARFGVRWYSRAAALSAVGLGIAGLAFFARTPQRGIHWQAPWLSLCVLTALTLLILPAFSMLEGCNQIQHVYLYRFVWVIVQNLTICSSVLLGLGLWTPVAGTLATLTWGVAFLWFRFRRFFRSLHQARSRPGIDWRREMLPMQWRIALSWLSGYFCFWLFTPVLFHYRGPAVAGQMGMTWSLVSALSSVSSLWLYTRVPRFGVLIARKEYGALDRLARRSAVFSCAVALAGALAIGALVWALNRTAPRFAERLLPPLPIAFFLVATVLMQVSYVQASYLRAHKAEPFVWASLISGLLTAGLTVALGRSYGAVGVAAGYLANVALFVLPVGTLIWWRCRRDWHSDRSPLADFARTT